MKLPIVYIKDNLVLQKQNKQDKSLLLQDNFELSENKNVNTKGTSLVCSDYIDLSHQLIQPLKTTNVFNDFIELAQYSFYLYNPQITIQDNLVVSQFSYNVSNIQTIKCNQKIVFNQNWCNSDNLFNQNLIQYYVNADILVNNVKYNTFNISRYKFDIRDDFNFFVGNIKQLLNEDKEIKTVVQISGQLQQQTSKQLLSEKLQIDNKQYSVISNIDGLILNNKIHLSVGKHNIKIKKTNTTKVSYFDIQVLAPYRRQRENVYMLDIYDLNNAKFYSNYQVQQYQVNISDNTIEIS